MFIHHRRRGFQLVRRAWSHAWHGMRMSIQKPLIWPHVPRPSHLKVKLFKEKMRRQSAADGGAFDMPMIPSAAEKKAAAAQRQLQEQYEEEIATLEADKQSALEQAGAAEQRCVDLEQQRDQTAYAFEQQLANQASDFRAREEKNLEFTKAQEAASQAAAKSAADVRAALEADKSGLESRLAELSTRASQLQEQLSRSDSQRDAETERASALAAKLAQAQAEKKGVENMHEAAQKQFEQTAAIHTEGARASLADVQSRLDATEARFASVEEARDSATEKAATLTSQLAGANADVAALQERNAALERRLNDEMDAMRTRLDATETARADAVARREETLSQQAAERQELSLVTAEKAALAALVPKLEARLNEEQAAERERSDTHIARAEAHVAEAREQRAVAQSEIVMLREEMRAAAAAATASEQRLNERVQHLQLELATWPTRFEAAETKMEALQARYEETLAAKAALEPELATNVAEKRGLQELVRRTEAWGEQQAAELKQALALSTARLEAAALERVSLLEQKEAAADGWHRAQEGLAASQAEKRAADAAILNMERALDMERARNAKLEAELRALGASARSACRRVEELGTLQAKTLSVESTVEARIEAERSKLQTVLAGERERSQTFVEATFLQQHSLVEQQQAALRQQQLEFEEQRAHRQEQVASEAAVDRERLSAARSNAVAAAAVATRELDQPPLPPLPPSIDPNSIPPSIDRRALGQEQSVRDLLDLQREIRQGSADLQGSLRHKHVETVLGGAPMA